MEKTSPKVTFSVEDTSKDSSSTSKATRSPLRRTMSQYRHIEIFKFGRRVLKPPGGEDSDIFGVRTPSTPSTPLTASPRRSKGPASSIFGYGDEIDRASVSSGASTPRRKMSTSSQERLFGSEEFSTPRRVVDRMKSSVFDGQRSAPTTPVAVNKKYISRNPITGDVYTVGSPARQIRGGSSDCSSNGSVSPVEGVRPNGRSGPLF